MPRVCRKKKLKILFCLKENFVFIFVFVFVGMYYLIKRKEIESYYDLRLGNLLSLRKPTKGSCHYLHVSIGFYLYIGLGQALGHMTLMPAKLYVWAFWVSDPILGFVSNFLGQLYFLLFELSL